MMQRIAKLAFIIVAATAAACGKDSGTSQAFGLYENGENLVATFHGFMDNNEACQLAAGAFNRESQSDPAAWAAIGRKPDEWICAALEK